ncbi:hypothetical protein LDENG_00171090 [Lucifuga dentata]|nr:hypothetical protein LDENG_00171090 [Lucifuga dentata]
MEGHLICAYQKKVPCDSSGAQARAPSSGDAASGGAALAGSKNREDSTSAVSAGAENPELSFRIAKRPIRNSQKVTQLIGKVLRRKKEAN